MNEKVKFIADWQSKEFTMAALCRQYNISRKTGYKILARYDEDGVDGLKEQSRAHHCHPDQIDKQIIRELLVVKKRFPNWGPNKIKLGLQEKYPERIWPASSTIGDIFKRHGLVKPRKIRAKAPPYTAPFISCKAPNRVWSADFKGQFRLGMGQMCYPLTVTDNYSRFILACKAFYNTKGSPVKKHFESIFIEYGLPEAIRTDNGIPFASPALGGLSQLSIWWLKLGIKPERIKPGCPQENGRHERMHRTLKESTVMPPSRNLQAQQRAFNCFREEFNFERPHEGINSRKPADIYQASAREYPNKLPEVEYGSAYEVRYVRSNGQIKWKGGKFFISECLYGEPIGLKEIVDGIWGVYFLRLKLGNLNLKVGRVV
jgi:transposase InsO family protein